MYIKRQLAAACKEYKKFPVIAILGPRQSGKTTLARYLFDKYTFVSLEDTQKRDFAQNDPQRFLRELDNKHGVIIDEFQYVPQLLSYIKLIVDEYKRPGYFVLTGSQNFLMNQAITQSLAGRVGILTLLPFSLKELIDNDLVTDIDHTILYGGYPRIYDEHIVPNKFIHHMYTPMSSVMCANSRMWATCSCFKNLCSCVPGVSANY